MTKTTIKFKFFIYFIESPSDADLYDNVSEKSIITQIAKLNSVPCIVRTTPSITTFKKALSTGLVEAIKSNSGLCPIIHISAHGNDNGIQLMNGEVVMG